MLPLIFSCLCAQKFVRVQGLVSFYLISPLCAVHKCAIDCIKIYDQTRWFLKKVFTLNQTLICQFPSPNTWNRQWAALITQGWTRNYSNFFNIFVRSRFLCMRRHFRTNLCGHFSLCATHTCTAYREHWLQPLFIKIKQ